MIKYEKEKNLKIITDMINKIRAGRPSTLITEPLNRIENSVKALYIELQHTENALDAANRCIGFATREIERLNGGIKKSGKED